MDKNENYFWNINSVEDYLEAKKDGFPNDYISNSVEMLGATLLHQAARKCNIELISYLIEKEEFGINKIDLTFSTPFGYIINEDTSIYSTAYNGCQDFIRIISAVNLLRNEYKAGCIYKKVKYENDFIESFLVPKLDCFEDEGLTPYYYAQENYFWNIKSVKDVKRAKKYGFPLNYFSISDDMPGATILHQAARICNLELISYLIDNEGFDVNNLDGADNCTPLGYLVNELFFADLIDEGMVLTEYDGCNDAKSIIEAIYLLRNNYNANCIYYSQEYDDEFIENYITELQKWVS
jgi:hypothetical protein